MGPLSKNASVCVVFALKLGTLMTQLLVTSSLAAASGAYAAMVRPPKPKSLGFPPNLALGDDAIASCFVPRASWTGEGLQMTWTRGNGQDLSANRRVSLMRASESSVTLGIRDARPADVGNYTCVASYAATSESVTVPLVVSGEAFKLRFGVSLYNHREKMEK
ncbi:hypothetical protein V5799_008407 [Amblyomma americanum]|uniref:Ig-like domain-containing protein n=1 Tax=Amblyomma americanum TaxID=6943 RepID=A0AAQ4FDA3_AMBAM